MCGILGTINLPFDEALLDLIGHRGPDERGVLSRRVGSHDVQFGHCRLSIVDLSASGRQPMETPDGRHLLIFNGEIYNHLDLRRDLGPLAYRGHCDTETVLHTMALKGVCALKSFNGIFSLAFLSVPRHELILARDPFGVKPLYYWHGNDSLAFCSELKPLLALVNDDIDRDSLAELLRLRFLPAPDTLFKNIHKVRPGHYMKVRLRNGKIDVTEAQYVPTIPEPCIIGYREAVREYRRLLERAVERQLMSDVEVGMLLSGGVDSALVGFFAQRHAGYKMKAFTVGFGEDCWADELPEARETADLIGMEHHAVTIGFDDFLGMVHKCIRIVEEPLATTSLVPMFWLAELAARQVKVVLTGQGADEPLGGYGRYQGELLRSWLPRRAVSAVRPLVHRLGVRNDAILRGAEALSIAGDIDRFVKVYEVFDEEWVQRLVGASDCRSRDRLQFCYDLLNCANRQTSAERMMACDLRMNLADDLLLYTDKITMHHSLECRVPMLDTELIAFVESLPLSYRLRWHHGKRIHKDVASQVLSRVIVRRKKKGFMSPTQTWFERTQALRSILLTPRSAFSRYLDAQSVEKVLNEHGRGYNRERQIFLLLCLYYWMEEFCRPPRKPEAYLTHRATSEHTSHSRVGIGAETTPAPLPGLGRGRSRS